MTVGAAVVSDRLGGSGRLLLRGFCRQLVPVMLLADRALGRGFSFAVGIATARVVTQVDTQGRKRNEQ